MRISEQALRIITRDLLLRAARAADGEAQALRFRALHLNLPLIAEIALRLALTDADRLRTEHAALDGLHEAVRLYDPYGEAEFTEFAAAFVEWQIRTQLRDSARRATVRRRPAAVARTISRRTAPPGRR